MRIDKAITTSAPPQRAFDYLSDFTTTTEWEPGTVSTVLESGDGGLGTRYRNTSRFLGRSVEVVYTVEVFEAGRRIRLRGENEALLSHDDITVIPLPHEAGSTVRYIADFDFRGPIRLATPLLSLAVAKLGRDGVRGMREALNQL